MHARITRVTTNLQGNYLIYTDDQNRCGYPMVATLSGQELNLNPHIHELLKKEGTNAQIGRKIEYHQEGCFDIIEEISDEKARAPNKSQLQRALA